MIFASACSREFRSYGTASPMYRRAALGEVVPAQDRAVAWKNVAVADDGAESRANDSPCSPARCDCATRSCRCCVQSPANDCTAVDSTTTTAVHDACDGDAWVLQEKTMLNKWPVFFFFCSFSR